MPDYQTDPEGMPELEAETQAKTEIDRRFVIKALAAGTAVFPILPAAAQHAHHAASAKASAAYTPQLIKGAQRDLLTAVCDRIIPRTDTPGAADVGIADEIDWIATRRKGIADRVADALQKVNSAAGKPFTTLSTEDQDAVLRKMSANLDSDEGKAFVALKELTIDGYYRTQGGLTEELGWNANTYVADFKGCTHDHAPVAEAEVPAAEVAG